MVKTRLGFNCECAIVGNSRTTVALIHVKRGGNGPIGTSPPAVSGLCCAFLALLLNLPEPVGGTSSTAICSGLPVPRSPAILCRMGTKSRETIYGSSVRAAAERATEARKQANRLAVDAWNKRMLGFQGPAQPSPALGDALNAGCRYLEVKCLGCNTHQTVALDIVRRPKTTPIHELERYMRCRQCSEVRRYPYKRSHLVALRPTKISASDPPSTWWPGER
jgi:hypothetical protein